MSHDTTRIPPSPAVSLALMVTLAVGPLAPVSRAQDAAEPPMQEAPIEVPPEPEQEPVIVLPMPVPVEPVEPAPDEAAPATQPRRSNVLAPATRPVVPPRNGGGPYSGKIEQRDGGLVFDFRDAPIDVVLDELSAAAGFVVVKTVKPEGRVTLTSRQPVSREDAVKLLNTVLYDAGYGAVPQGRILKIVPRDQAKRLSIPVHTGNDPTKIEPSDELITQVIPLRYADATQLHRDLQPLINPEADFASNASSNALVITDTAANVRRVVQIINALDTSLADAVEVKVFPLEYASATSAASLINNIFSNQLVGGAAPGQPGQPGQNGGGPGGRWRMFQQMQQQAQQAGQGQGARTARVTAAADERTNSLVVTGPVDTLETVAAVVRELDANPVADETVFVYRLKNGQALNLETVVNSLFGNPTSGTRGTPAAQQGAAGTPRSGTRSTTGGGVGTGGRTSTGTGTRGRSGTSTAANRLSAPTNQAAAPRVSAGAQQAAAALAGQVSIIADPDTNSLLVRTTPGNYERVQSILDELDRPVAQVLIKVLIAEVTHTDTLDLGAEFSALNIAATTTGTFNNLGATGVEGFVSVINADMSVNLRALAAKGKLDVLSRPYILASDNQLATITVGQEVPFITNSRITDTGQTINTIQYDDVGILLDVVPHINPDGLVILDIAPEISTLTADTVPISGDAEAPVIAKRSAQSRVGVRTGQTVVIGGLMEDRRVDRRSKVPFLGDIPGVGGLFRRTTNAKTKTELLIFLTPHVAAVPDQLEDMAEQELDGAKLTPDAVSPGTFQEHLDGLHRGEPAPVERQR